MGFYPFAPPSTKPSGPAGGDLSGTYPNPVVSQVDGLALGSEALTVALGAMALQGTTGDAGYTLVNGTGVIISWTAPNDGNMHRVMVFSWLNVTVTEVGGNIQLSYTGPTGGVNNSGYQSGSQNANVYVQSAFHLVAPGSTVSLQQQTALTGGTAVFYAELWGS